MLLSAVAVRPFMAAALASMAILHPLPRAPKMAATRRVSPHPQCILVRGHFPSFFFFYFFFVARGLTPVGGTQDVERQLGAAEEENRLLRGLQLPLAARGSVGGEGEEERGGLGGGGGREEEEEDTRDEAIVMLSEELGRLQVESKVNSKKPHSLKVYCLCGFLCVRSGCRESLGPPFDV